MIGIVAVSHSHTLAHAAVALAGEMLGGQPVRIEIAAGLDEQTFGTDAVAVSEAIAAADSGDGVLVLMDMGSAVLSAELALDLLADDHRVRLCAAPFVEGLIAAAVSAAGGADLDEAAAEASNALVGKQTHFDADAACALSGISESGKVQRAAEIARVIEWNGRGFVVGESAPVSRAEFVVDNPHGLHARPAARLVGAVRGLDSSMLLGNLTTGAGPAPASSLSRIAALGALAGHRLEVAATGADAAEAVDRVLALAARHFDEAPGLVTEAAPVVRGTGPLPASPGIGIGPSWQLATVQFDTADLDDPGRAETPAGERRRLDAAIGRVRAEIDRLRVTAGTEAGIFEAHQVLLDDTEVLDAVHSLISSGTGAAHAWARVLDDGAAELDRLPDEYQRARAGDLRAVRDQVLAELTGRATRSVSRAGVLVAADLTPAQAAALDPAQVTGIVLANGSPTAHSTILVRAHGIPAVVGAGRRVLETAAGTTVALDGQTGELVIDPDPEVLAEFTERAVAQRLQRAAALVAAGKPAVTRDGMTVHVAANISDLADASAAVRNGADLAGLVRTEFLFLGRADAPSIDEQEQAYRALAEALDGRKLILRTLDVGGDKPLPYIEQPPEANPFLGMRGIRLTLARPELLRDQLTAIGRVAADHPVGVMFPMVTQLSELLTARHMLSEVVPPHIPLDIGIMVEVPATAAKTAAFADHVDFLSIGTNDLTQYAMAAERGNESLGSLADPLDPGVLHLIDMVSRAATGRARVAVCGEAAADPGAAPILLGLGVHELSVGPPSIPLVKAAVRELDSTSCRALAVRALTCSSAEEVRALIP